MAAAQRLHHDDGNAALRRIRQPRIARLELPIDKIVLNLADVPIERVDDLLKQVEIVVEGKADVADAATVPQALHKIDQPMILDDLPLLLVDRVKQIKIQIFHAQPIHLLFKQGGGAVLWHVAEREFAG